MAVQIRSYVLYRSQATTAEPLRCEVLSHSGHGCVGKHWNDHPHEVSTACVKESRSEQARNTNPRQVKKKKTITLLAMPVEI